MSCPVFLKECMTRIQQDLVGVVKTIHLADFIIYSSQVYQLRRTDGSSPYGLTRRSGGADFRVVTLPVQWFVALCRSQRARFLKIYSPTIQSKQFLGSEKSGESIDEGWNSNTTGTYFLY